MTAFSRLLVWGALLPVAAACARPTAETSPTSAGDVPAPPEAFLARLAEDERIVGTVRGLAKVRYEGRGEGGTVSQVILVALPGHARLESLSPLGTAILVLAIREDELSVYAPLRGEYGRGRATRDTLERLVQLRVPPGPLLRLLAGLPPLPVRSGDPRMHLSVQASGIHLESVDGPFWQRVWTGPDGQAVERGELGEASGPLLQFEFAERRPLQGVRFPFAIRVQMLSAESSVSIRYETVQINSHMGSEMFDLPRPAEGGTRTIDLGHSAWP